MTTPHIIGIIILIIYTIMDALADAYMFRDGKGNPVFQQLYQYRTPAGWMDELKNNQLWHLFQLIRQSVVIIAIGYFIQSWTFILMGGSFFWLVHDAIVNSVGLDRSIWHVGTTAWIDRQFQKTSHPELFMAIVKILSFSATLFFYLKY